MNSSARSQAFQFSQADVIAARREIAKRSLADFACLVDIPTVPLSDADDEDQFSVLRLNKLVRHHELLLSKLQGIEDGSIPNLMVLMPPGSAKSTYVDVVFVPWFMARKPRRNVIVASYASDIAKKQGRRARQLIQSRSFANLMDVHLKPDQSAADEWALTNGSEYMSGGLLSGLTGNRAALGVVDDPIRGREAAESETIRNKTWDTYIDDFCSRLIPGAPQVMILCMVGGTRVLMADGAEKALRDIRPGDAIATYKDGRLATSAVQKWANQGPDSVFRIRTSSGTIVEANERHPFLVERNGVREWRRISELKLGDLMLRAVRGAASSVLRKDVASQFPAKGSADLTTTNTSGLRDIDRHRSIQNPATLPKSSIDTACVSMSFEHCCESSVANAQSAASRPEKTCEPIGAESCASITTTGPGKPELCFATTAICSSDTARLKRSYCAPLDIYEITLDAVEDISAIGREDVFDIQVAETENFIANGLVSHNTRWHEDDPAGRILPEGWDGESGLFEGRDGRQWYVLCLPAIADRAADPLGRAIGETLWPEWFSHEHWAPFQRNRRTWSSLYQQKPTAEEGTFFKKDWFRRYTPDQLPANLHKYISSDHAPAGEDDSDYSCVRVWGIDHAGDLYLLDGFRHQETMDKTAERVVGNKAESKIGLLQKHKPFAWFPEDDNNWKAVSGFVKKAMNEQKQYCVIAPISPHGADKAVKAQSFQGMASMGRVWLPVGPEGDDVLAQYLKFPGGKNDDEVDAAGVIGRAIDQAHPAIVPITKKEDPKYPNQMSVTELIAQRRRKRLSQD